MAKNDNLTDFLTDVADAIRSKKGTSAKINPQNFANEIASIETGGGGGGGDNALPTAGVNDVTFYDYNGHILYSYSRTDFLALTEMPAGPSRDGLLFTEWTHDLDEAQEYVRLYRRLNIGATYTTSNGRTQIYFDVYSDENLQRKIVYSVDISAGTRVYFGDGRSGTNSGTGSRTWSPTYPSKGSYVMELEISSDATVGLGSASYGYPFFGATARNNASYQYPTGAGLKKILCGDNITYCYNNVMAFEPSLAEIVLPRVRSLGNYSFASAGISCCVFPKTIESIGEYALAYCGGLRTAIMPNSISSLSPMIFYQCYALQSVNIPNSVENLPESLFTYCSNLEVVTIPKSVKSIGNSCFRYCKSLRLVNMSKHEQVPTLGSSAFENYYYMKIVVPDALYDEWKAATNWSSFASNIVKASEYFID